MGRPAPSNAYEFARLDFFDATQCYRVRRFQQRPSRQAAFFGTTVANGALQTLLDLQLAPLSRD